MQFQICYWFRPLGEIFYLKAMIHDVHFQWLFQSVLYKSTPIQNYFCDSVFWRHLWCFNRVRGPLVTAPDLFCVQCIQQQGRACLSTLNALGHLYTMSCTLYTCLFCVFIVQCLLLNSTCTWSLVHYVLYFVYLLVVCSLYNSSFSTLHALGHGFEGGLPWRIPATCTVHPPG